MGAGTSSPALDSCVHLVFFGLAFVYYSILEAKATNLCQAASKSLTPPTWGNTALVNCSPPRVFLLAEGP